MPLLSATAGDYPLQYNAFLTTTLQAYRKQMVDNVSDATPFWWWLNQKGRKQTQRGGESILVPLMYALNSVQTFAGYETLNTAPHEGIAPAVFLWKLYTVPVVLSKDQLTSNQGEAQILNLLQAEVKKAEISFIDQMNNDLCLNGADGVDVTGVNPKGVVGLPDMCQSSTQGRVYGGISAASGDSGDTWWENQHTAMTTDWTTPSGHGLGVMRSVYFDCVRGADAPDLLLCAQDFYENYDRSQLDSKRYVNTMAADAGFENLAYHGAVMMFDRDVSNGYCYFLNSNYLNLVVHPDVDMAPTEFVDADKTPNGQWAVFSRIFWKGALTCSNRARQGLVSNGTTY